MWLPRAPAEVSDWLTRIIVCHVEASTVYELFLGSTPSTWGCDLSVSRAMDDVCMCAGGGPLDILVLTAQFVCVRHIVVSRIRYTLEIPQSSKHLF